MTREELKEFVFQWNIRFPIDKWWRDKHKVAFLSNEHRESNFLYQLAEYEEDKLYSELENQEEYVPNMGKFLKPRIKEIVTQQDFISLAKQEMEDFPVGLLDGIK